MTLIRQISSKSSGISPYHAAGERDKAAVVIEDLVTLLRTSTFIGKHMQEEHTLVYTSFSQATEAGRLAMHDDWDLTPASE